MSGNASVLAMFTGAAPASAQAPALAGSRSVLAMFTGAGFSSAVIGDAIGLLFDRERLRAKQVTCGETEVVTADFSCDLADGETITAITAIDQSSGDEVIPGNRRIVTTEVTQDTCCDLTTIAVGKAIQFTLATNAVTPVGTRIYKVKAKTSHGVRQIIRTVSVEVVE